MLTYKFPLKFLALIGWVAFIQCQVADTGLKISYPNGVEVTYQQELTPTQVQSQPTIHWNGFEPNALYTLIMYDPDAPSRTNPTASPFLHWLVVNIPQGNIANGNALAEYIGAGPPRGTGLHRYIFAIHKQPWQIPFNGAFATRTSRNGRPNFDLSGFISQNQLGAVLTSNQFQAQWDEYVPILNQQLSSG